MTLFSVASLLFRLVGFAQWADSLWGMHVARLKAREVANSPTTRDELEKTLRDGKL